ncbi:PREDICTED: skin secretory protein xP2-like [Rhinopithecus bieti]|uniref:skin secretory protein xP2-like n=1 Tax=Rhinopithecus bieti TaxID=61621 RepID=UPI00083BF586|nr:PREDICTED: skin secretory protein xP2-like [Rhinopithecus bieti]
MASVRTYALAPSISLCQLLARKTPNTTGEHQQNSRRKRRHPPTFSPSIPSPGATHTLRAAAPRKWAATRVSSALPGERRRRPRLPPLFLFLGLFSLRLLPVQGHFSRDSQDGGVGPALSAAPAAASHLGPRPPDRGVVAELGWGPGSYTPGQDATAPGGWPRRRRGEGPGRLRSAPPPLPAPACVAAAGTPLPTPWGSLAPGPPGRGRSSGASSAFSHRGAATQSRSVVAASLPPKPPAPAQAQARAPAPAPACAAAAAAGREGEGGRGVRPRLPLAQVRAKVSAASAGGLGLSDAPSLLLSAAAAAAAPGAQLAVSLALCGALASLQREGREESGACR